MSRPLVAAPSGTFRGTMGIGEAFWLTLVFLPDFILKPVASAILAYVVYVGGWKQLKNGKYPWIGVAVIIVGFVAAVLLLLWDMTGRRG